MADIRIKDLADGSGVIDDTDFVVMDSAADGTRRVTVAQLRGALGGLQETYEVDPTIFVTTAQGTIAIANNADDTDLLTLSRNNAGDGRLVTGAMGAGTTDDAMHVEVLGTGRGLVLAMDNGGIGVVVENTVIGDSVELSEAGLIGRGGNVELTITTEQPGLGISARNIDITGGEGGDGTGGAASGDGAVVTITGGAAGADGGAGRGAAGDVVINAGDGATDGDVNIGLANTALVLVNPTAITLAASGGVARMQSSQASAGAVVVEATSASGTIRCNIAGTETLRVAGSQTLVKTGAGGGIAGLDDPDTGLVWPAANILNVVTGNTAVFQVGTATGISMSVGNAASPALNSLFDLDTGPYWPTGNVFAIATKGVDFALFQGTMEAATGDQAALDLTAVVNKATSGNYTGIKLSVTETSAPGTDDRLLDLRVGGSSKCFVDNAGAIGSSMFVLKAADETVVSSAALQDDNHLTVNLASGAKYHFEVHLLVEIEDVGGGIQVAMDGTAGFDNFRASASIVDTAGGGFSAVQVLSAFGAAVSTSTLDAGDHWVRIEGTIEVSAAGAGTFKVRWAQAVSDADDTIVKRGSTMKLVRTS